MNALALIASDWDSAGVTYIVSCVLYEFRSKLTYRPLLKLLSFPVALPYSLTGFSREHFLNNVFLHESLSKVFCGGWGWETHHRQTIV